jgi:hypothetical protein
MASMSGSEPPDRPLTAGAKTVKCVELRNLSQPADIGKAPPSRIYTKDYSKVQEKDDSDGVTQYLGNPLRW